MTVSVASRSTWLLALAGLLFLGGCEPESGPGTVHPVEARIPHFDNPDHTITGESSPDRGGAAQLRGATRQPAWSVGTREGAAPERFADIRDVEQDPQGRVLILDNENREVRVFTSDGEYVGTFGREGEGPGEFQYPAHLDILEKNRLVVAGRMGRIQFFEPAGQTYERTGGFAVEFTPEDACVLDGRLYLHGALTKEGSSSVHVYTPRGERKTSFGPVYDAENQFIRFQLSRGAVACDSSTDTVVFGFAAAPMLYGFAPDGTRKWVSRIQPFDPMPQTQGVSEQGTTRLRHSYEPGTDILSELTDVPGPGLVAQRYRYPADDEDRADTSIFTYWVSGTDGTGTFVRRGSIGGPAMGHLTHASSTHLFSARSAPIPSVVVYDARAVEWGPPKAAQ
jgi:hypothetical protein